MASLATQRQHSSPTLRLQIWPKHQQPTRCNYDQICRLTKIENIETGYMLANQLLVGFHMQFWSHWPSKQSTRPLERKDWLKKFSPTAANDVYQRTHTQLTASSLNRNKKLLQSLHMKKTASTRLQVLDLKGNPQCESQNTPYSFSYNAHDFMVTSKTSRELPNSVKVYMWESTSEGNSKQRLHNHLRFRLRSAAGARHPECSKLATSEVLANIQK